MGNDMLYYPRADINVWLKNTLGKRGMFSSKWGWQGRWSVSHRSTFALFSFMQKSDAVLFKLTWGGSL